VRFSAIVIPDASPTSFLRTVHEVEAAAVERLWTYDHLSWRRVHVESWYASLPLLAAAALSTTRLRLGPLVATPNFRHPVPLAQEVMTLDRLSEGRVDLGVGAGADGPDATVLGGETLSPRQRADRFRDWTQLLVQLLEHRDVTATSGSYQAVDARTIPGCHQQPRVPLTVAATGRRGMAMAARLASTWVTYSHPRHPAEADYDGWLEGLRQQSRTMADVAAQSQLPRPRAAVVIGLTNRAPFTSARRYEETVDALTEAGFDDVYAHWPRPDGSGMPRDLIDATLERSAVQPTSARR
jgi:alkanesulfonate monooxygenase SsuD/methylene tetrahydromethanopterin reductase-like flavin-dependent oxidoreductase (luciferase family)